MGVRESLLNTITSVADSDFVRIVTSAGASSKATVRNLFKGFESNLSAKSSLTTSDYIRVVGSDNESYKQLVSDVAKKIIENYTGSSLAGSSQSVKSALDSLNSNLSNLIRYKDYTLSNLGFTADVVGTRGLQQQIDLTSDIVTYGTPVAISIVSIADSGKCIFQAFIFSSTLYLNGYRASANSMSDNSVIVRVAFRKA